MVTIKRGDLLEATEKIIAHQVNCRGVAGGLAWAIFNRYPDAENDYQQLVERFEKTLGSPMLLGFCQPTGEQRDGHIIANLFGQLDPGQDYRPGSLLMALEKLAALAKGIGASVALPYKLSCGICGGDWREVLPMIEHTMRDVECVIYQREEDD